MKDIKERFKSLRIRPWDPSLEVERHIIKQMIDFAHHPEARTVPQFLALKEIGWKTLKYWTTKSYRFNNAYQAMLSILWCKWFDFAMDSKKLPAHQAKIVDKYLNIYDENLFEAMSERAKEIAGAASTATAAYTAENYKALPLETPYKEIYQDNDRKRIDTAGNDDKGGGGTEAEPVPAKALPEADPEGAG